MDETANYIVKEPICASWGHPLKGTWQEKKVFHEQEKALFYNSRFF
jgi:hypothetical protein